MITQAQKDAAIKAYEAATEYPYSKDALIAALTATAQAGPAIAFEVPRNEIKGIKVEGCTFEAAAQVGESQDLWKAIEVLKDELGQLRAEKAATIERCAQVVKHFPTGDPTLLAAIEGAILNLRDEPNATDFNEMQKAGQQLSRQMIEDAAQAGEPLPSRNFKDGKPYDYCPECGRDSRYLDAATIKRCAQWLNDLSLAKRSAVSGGDGTERGWIEATALDYAAAEIRKLKDET